MPAPDYAISSISTPTSAEPGGTITIAWDSADPEDAVIVTYILQRQLNNSGNWTARYIETALSYNDTLPSSDVTSVRYRVMGTSTYGDTDYTVSPLVPVSYRPTVPSSITVPSTITPGATVIITWGT